MSFVVSPICHKIQLHNIVNDLQKEKGKQLSKLFTDKGKSKETMSKDSYFSNDKTPSNKIKPINRSTDRDLNEKFKGNSDDNNIKVTIPLSLTPCKIKFKFLDLMYSIVCCYKNKQKKRGLPGRNNVFQGVVRQLDNSRDIIDFIHTVNVLDNKLNMMSHRIAKRNMEESKISRLLNEDEASEASYSRDSSQSCSNNEIIKHTSSDENTSSQNSSNSAKESSNQSILSNNQFPVPAEEAKEGGIDDQMIEAVPIPADVRSEKSSISHLIDRLNLSS